MIKSTPFNSKIIIRLQFRHGTHKVGREMRLFTLGAKALITLLLKLLQ